MKAVNIILSYDSYSLYEKFKDPGFQYGVTLAETAGHAI